MLLPSQSAPVDRSHAQTARGGGDSRAYRRIDPGVRPATTSCPFGYTCDFTSDCPTGCACNGFFGAFCQDCGCL